MSRSRSRRHVALNRRDFLSQSILTGLALQMPDVLRAAPNSTASLTPRLRAAVVGHTGRGDYGHGLESIFSNRPGVEVVALADPDWAGRARIAAKIGAARTFEDYREMLDQARPSLVSVAMRHADQHHAICLAALSAGAHVYCEKPFTTTPSEADELLVLADQRGLRIAVAHTMRMTPVLVEFRRALSQGLIGDLIELRAYGKQDARAGGEDLMVLGTHLFDLMRFFAGDPSSCSGRVQWQGRDLRKSDGHFVKDNVGWVGGDEVFAQFFFSKGVTATFTSTARLRETVGHWGIELHGSKGAARVNCDIEPNVFVRSATAWSAEGKTDSWRPFDPKLDKTNELPHLDPVTDWLDAIATRREPECGGRNGTWAIEMVMAVYQSTLRGSLVTFPLRDRSHPLAREL